MICLDTNYLIMGVSPGSAEASEMTGWYRSGEAMITAMPAWFEFLCGPVTEPQEAAIKTFISGIVPFEERQARLAAELFNALGRRRQHRVDSMIAATAIIAGARLATSNRDDFLPFVPHGLRLA